MQGAAPCRPSAGRGRGLSPRAILGGLSNPAVDCRLKLAGSVKLQDPQQQKRKEEIYDGQKMAWEIRELKAVVESMDCPIVLSHLDLLANNIFVPADSQVSS